MLKKQNRLSTTYEFEKVKRLGRYYKARLFHIYFLPLKDPNAPTRVGIVVSNNFHKSAVVRNRIKRLFREAIRQKFDRIRNGLWIVIYPKFISIDKTYEEISFDFDQFLQKLPIAG